MKSIISVIIFSILLTSCASKQLTCAGQCSLQGMVCSGAMVGSSYSSAYNFQTGQTAFGNNNANMAMCRQPANQQEVEDVRVIQAEANKHLQSQNQAFWLTFFGVLGGGLILLNAGGGN
ncbi:hypothetical protein [Halobacteriovorax sp.]|uniref:hypothetical protein n=1 Tax=Halobacteriovorax sp. TaxID=2020862 RepID=UPI003AF2DAD6